MDKRGETKMMVFGLNEMEFVMVWALIAVFSLALIGLGYGWGWVKATKYLNKRWEVKR